MYKRQDGMFKEENMALVCFNVALKEYLSSVIGDLNLKNIKVFSFDKWAYNLVRNYSNIGFINYNAKISDETIEMCIRDSCRISRKARDKETKYQYVD